MGQVRGPRVSQFSGPPRGPGIARGPQLQQWGQAAQALNPVQQQQLLQHGSAQLAQGSSLDRQQRQQLQWMLQSLVGTPLALGLLTISASVHDSCSRVSQRYYCK